MIRNIIIAVLTGIIIWAVLLAAFVAYIGSGIFAIFPAIGG